MLPGRSNENKYLENCYNRTGSQLLVVYGREGIGKTSLLLDFCKNKDFDYYLARECSESEQLRCFASELDPSGQVGADYQSIFSKISSVHCRKRILIIDEFQNFLKNSDEFMDHILELIHDQWNNQSFMVILSSSAFSWVENAMVSQIGQVAYEISGFLKVKELSFLDLVRRYPKYSFKEALTVYSVLGGVPGLWRYFSSTSSPKENICRTILKKGTVLHSQSYNEISQKLREPAVYQTILKRMAGGEDKLNDLFISTGYNRAKISVYLKNLMEIEMVEKVYNEDTEGRDNARKGIYKLSNDLVSFWFRFVFPHLSMLEIMSEEEFYDKYIEPELNNFMGSAFKRVCREYMVLLSQTDKFPEAVSQFGSWSGKVGDIDIIGKSESGFTVCGFCNWEKSQITYDDFEWYKFCVKQAKIKCDHYYIFAGGSFDQKLVEEAKNNDSLLLIDPSML